MTNRRKKSGGGMEIVTVFMTALKQEEERQ
jgi:hypothetical protein